MQGLFILGVYLAYLGFGLVTPFVMGLGYVWVDIFSPQDVYPAILGQFPVAMILGAGTFLAWLALDRRSRPTLNFTFISILIFAIWMTLTCYWAEVPDAAWKKWDWAFKTMIFAAFMPYLFRSRVQIEAIILTIIFSLSGSILAFGMKSLLGGGGYGMQLSIVAHDSGMGESSTLSMLSVVAIPLVLFTRRHSVVLPKFRLAGVAFGGIILCCVTTVVGSFARTGLVSLAVCGILLWWQSRNKLLLLGILTAICLILPPLMNDRWLDRMSTITAPDSESSALTRIAVWAWTLDYVDKNPRGGGFDVYRINHFTIPTAQGGELTINARAFHSIYFEILGEMGIPGFGIWSAIIMAFYCNMLLLRHRTKGVPHLAWLGDLARTLMTSVTIYLAGGAFIGVAYQPILYYLIAVSVAATQYYRRCRRDPKVQPFSGWSDPNRVSGPLAAVSRTVS